MAGNETLARATRAKNDEFYTQLLDIEAELRHYRDKFRGKVVFCNCDDPYESNFFKYFAMNFNYLGLKKLVTTAYTGSPITGEQLSLLDIAGMPKGAFPGLPGTVQAHRDRRARRGHPALTDQLPARPARRDGHRRGFPP